MYTLQTTKEIIFFQITKKKDIFFIFFAGGGLPSMDCRYEEVCRDLLQTRVSCSGKGARGCPDNFSFPASGTYIPSSGT